eukprot:m51a1_g2631 hypothetical protein (199) ;mRNA; f:570917-571711
MPLVSVDDRAKADILALGEQPAEVYREFARIAAEFTRRGPNRKLCDRAASRLGVAPDVVNRAVDALAHWAKADATEAEASDALAMQGLGAELSRALIAAYASSRAQLRAALSGASFDGVARYADLRWRLDVEVASRCVRGAAEPLFLLRLDTAGGQGGAQQTFLEADPSALKSVCAALEGALAEAKTASVRRVMRNIR